MAISKKTNNAIIQKNIEGRIYLIRGKRVMLDKDLAGLYNVETRALKQAVKRNRNRFPDDFMFILSNKEINGMVSQSVIPSKSYFGGASPMVFTEQGVSMLSSVLKSETSIEMNILIMRTFSKVKNILNSNRDLKRYIDGMLDRIEKKLGNHDQEIKLLYEMMGNVLDDPKVTKRKIGFRR